MLSFFSKIYTYICDNKIFIYLQFLSKLFMIICDLANEHLELVFFTQLECVLYCTMFEINEPLFFYNINCFVKPGGKKLTLCYLSQILQ